MRVILNGLAALKPKTGVGHYVAQLAAHMPCATLYPGDVPAVVRRLAASKSGTGTGTPTLRGLAIQTAKHLGKIAVGVHFARTSRIGFDLYHEPNFIPLPCELPTVLTVHDLSVLKFPHWHPADRVRHHERHFHAATRRAACIVVVSEAVRHDALAHGVPAHKLAVVHNGVSSSFRPMTIDRAGLGVPERFTLCVGTIEPRKNLLTVMRAFADLPAAAREACPLILAGPWGWRSEAERAFFESTAKPRGARHLGYVSDADLPALYNAASALLYPSFYEGFGLPPAEMLACGGAVVYAQEAAAVREVVGDCGEALPAEDVPAWRRMLLRIAAGELRPAPDGVVRAARFTWAKCATETRAIYGQVLGLRAAA